MRSDDHFYEQCNGELCRQLKTLVPDQVERVSKQDYCDIDGEFLGFVDTYYALSLLIPRHWTIVDLGCAYAPQSYYFREHKQYIGVEPYGCEKFHFPNSIYFTMRADQFIAEHASKLDLKSTFAICNYTPSIVQEAARRVFGNLFAYYPAHDPNDPRLRPHDK